MDIFKSWANVRCKQTQIEYLSPADLDIVLHQFYAEVTKQNGQDHESNSLAAMQAGNIP